MAGIRSGQPSVVNERAQQPAADRGAATWRVRRTTPVRADATGVFVALHEIGDAAVGDAVELFDGVSPQPVVGTIVDLPRRDGELYARVELRP